jgi:hypothetical protein
MLDDAFKLTLDRIYKTDEQANPFPVPGYEDALNLWLSLN